MNKRIYFLLFFLFFLSIFKSSPGDGAIASLSPPQPWLFFISTSRFFIVISLAILLTLTILNGNKAKTNTFLYILLGSYCLSKTLFQIKNILVETDKTPSFMVNAVLEIFSGYIIPPCLTMTTIYLLRNNVKSFKTICNIILTCCTVYSLATIHTLIAAPLYSIREGRLFGLGNHPVDTASIFCIGLFYVYEAYIRTSSSLKKSGLIICAITFTYLILLTGSRTGIVVIPIVLFPYIYQVRKKHIVVAISFLISTISIVTYYSENALRALSTEDTRSEVYTSLTSEFKNNIFFGTNSTYINSENSYLYYLARTGIFGLLIITPFLRSFFWIFTKTMMNKSRTTNPFEKSSLRFTLYMTFLLFIFSNANWFLWSDLNFLYLLIWINLGCLYFFCFNKNQPKVRNI